MSILNADTAKQLIEKYANALKEDEKKLGKVAYTQQFPGVFVTDTGTSETLKNRVNKKVYKQHSMFMERSFRHVVDVNGQRIECCTLMLKCKPILCLGGTATAEISNQLAAKSLKSETQATDGREQHPSNFADSSVGAIFFATDAPLFSTDKIYESILCLPEALDIIKSHLNQAHCQYKIDNPKSLTVGGRSLTVSKIVPAPNQLDANEKKQFVDNIMKLARLAPAFALDELRIDLSALKLPTQNDEPNEASLLQAINSLQPKEKQMMQLRFGLNGKEKHSPKEIATLMKVSEASVSRLEKRVMEKLKQI